MRTVLTILILTALLAAGVAAEEAKGEKPEKPVKLDGKKLFREMCKVCHGPDAEAGEYTPMYLIQDQWTRFFEEDYAETHEGLTYDDETKSEVLEAVTPAMLKAIYDFCIEGAADSEQPMTCG